MDYKGWGDDAGRERMGGDPLSGEPHFVEAVYGRKDAVFPMPLNVSFDQETGGVLIRKFYGYVLPPPEIHELFELALRAAEVYGEQEMPVFVFLMKS